MMKSKMIVCSLALACVSPASADFAGRVGFSNGSMDSVWSGGVFSADHSTTNFGLSYFLEDGYFLDLSIRQGDDATPDQTLDNGTFNNFSRDDTTYTIGKALGDGITVFGGMINTEYTVDVTQTVDFSETIEMEGFYVGAGKQFPMETGSISISAAFADLDLDLSYGGALAGVFQPFSESGSGLSYTVSYTYPVNDNVAINAEYKNQSYGFDSADDEVDQFGINLVYGF
jgi:hypothetical protein